MLTVGTDSYISIEDAATYITEQGLTPLSDAETSLKRATRALDRIYAARFIGLRVSVKQPLHWPRAVSRPASYLERSENSIVVNAYHDEIPKEVAQATVELAVLLEAGINPYQAPEPIVKKQKTELDVIKTEVEYASTQGHRPDPLFIVTLILQPVLESGSLIRFTR